MNTLTKCNNNTERLIENQSRPGSPDGDIRGHGRQGKRGGGRGGGPDSDQVPVMYNKPCASLPFHTISFMPPISREMAQ